MNYGPVWVDLQGTSVLAEEKEILNHPNTGGVILFTKNFVNKQQIIDLVKSIRDTAQKQLLIAVDHEGGRIWRFTEGFTRPPAARDFGYLYSQDPERAILELKQAGNTIAAELIDCDIDLSFAPVLDIDHGVSTVIGNRSYGSNANIVTVCAQAFISGLNQAGMGAVGKHFPGHGGCAMDSHFTITEDTRSLEEISAKDLIPFKKLHHMLAGIMPAHVIYPAIDNKPAGFSEFWLQRVLREEIGFQGAIISDCLSMHGAGVIGKMVEGAYLALQAGCDMIITTQQSREYLLQVLNELEWSVTRVQQQRICGLEAKRSLEEIEC